MDVDHGLTVPLSLMFGQPQAWPCRVIPFAVNVVQYPPPSGNRCYQLGKAIRTRDRFVRRRSQRADLGHRRHEPPAAGAARRAHQHSEFDTQFLDTLVTDPESLTRIPHVEYIREAGSEGIELVMWLIMRGALDAQVARCIASITCRPRTRPSATSSWRTRSR